MQLFGDYHTHSTYSSGKFHSKHAKGSIMENAMIAKEKGLKELGISEHGLGHKLYALQRSNINKMRHQIEEAKKATGVNILLGVEANIISSKGDIDMSEEEIKMFDYIIVGFHQFAKAKSVKEFFKFFVPNLLGVKSKKITQQNTIALTNAMRRYPIKFISHPAVKMPINLEEVVRVAMETNTMLEINGKRINYSEKDVQILKENNIKLIINSDAHSPKSVGEVNKPLNFIIKNKIQLNKIDNLIG